MAKSGKGAVQGAVQAAGSAVAKSGKGAVQGAGCCATVQWRLGKVLCRALWRVLCMQGAVEGAVHAANSVFVTSGQGAAGCCEAAARRSLANVLPSTCRVLCRLLCRLPGNQQDPRVFKIGSIGLNLWEPLVPRTGSRVSKIGKHCFQRLGTDGNQTGKIDSSVWEPLVPGIGNLRFSRLGSIGSNVWEPPVPRTRNPWFQDCVTPVPMFGNC